MLIEYDGYTLEKTDGLGILTFNRPDRYNAMTTKMIFVEFPKLFKDLHYDDDIRALIITGTGDKAFSAGFDVNEIISATGGRPPEWNILEKMQPFGYFAEPLYQLERPVIAALNGVAAGAGASMALLSDIRIASENARFSMAFVKRGLIPDAGATFLLPRLIGTSKAFEIMYTGDTIDAKTAYDIGLVNKIVPAASLMDEAKALAMKLLKNSPLALAQVKRAIHGGIVNNFEQQLVVESYAQALLRNTQDFHEATDAFLNKREPEFKGQ